MPEGQGMVEVPLLCPSIAETRLPYSQTHSQQRPDLPYAMCGVWLGPRL